MSDMGADEVDALEAYRWVCEIISAFIAQHNMQPNYVGQDDGGTWFVETKREAAEEWHRTFQVSGAPGQPITFVEI